MARLRLVLVLLALLATASASAVALVAGPPPAAAMEATSPAPHAYDLTANYALAREVAPTPGDVSHSNDGGRAIAVIGGSSPSSIGLVVATETEAVAGEGAL